MGEQEEQVLLCTPTGPEKSVCNNGTWALATPKEALC